MEAGDGLLGKPHLCFKRCYQITLSSSTFSFLSNNALIWEILSRNLLQVPPTTLQQQGSCFSSGTLLLFHSSLGCKPKLHRVNKLKRFHPDPTAASSPDTFHLEDPPCPSQPGVP